MEPQYMIIGQAAGVAAAISVQGHEKIQDVAVPELQERLQRRGAILHLKEEFSAGNGGR
jgi:hypothetical protein